ncbi:MAG: hypothetical protein JWM57_3522, partial [Phycisphaerales bacterium]|nr:hypothetical protein [Phycisphaerales bacterium]
ADDSARLMFLALPNPNNIPLERAGLEEGTLKELPGGTLLSTAESSVRGIPLFTVAAKDHQKLYLQQSVIAFDGVTYKVIAAGTMPISSDPRFISLFQSLNVLVPSPVAPVSKLSGHDISVKVGKIGIYALLIAGVIVISRRSRKRKQQQSTN